MPSKSALIVVHHLEKYLDRVLTESELLLVEELVINYYVAPICEYVNGLIRKESPKEFDMVYHPIMNGLIRGAYRRRDIIRMRGRFEQVYKRMHAFVGDGMSNAELEAVIFLAEDATDKELNAAIAVASARGVHHIKYVRAVIEGNRRAASRTRAAKEFKQYVPDEYGRKESVTVPRVDSIRQEWHRRLSEAQEKLKLADAELNARHKVQKRK